MALSLSSLLHYWSSRYESIPVVGGKPVHSRNSAAGWFDQRGVVQNAIVNTPRFQWATLDGDRRKMLLLEGAATNALTHSDEFDDASWVKTFSSVTPNAKLAPDGSLTADKFIEDATAAAQHWMKRTLPALTNNVDQPFSVFARADGAGWLEINSVNKAGTIAGAVYNLVTGVVESTAGAGVTARITPLAGGWNWIEYSFPSGVGATSPEIRMYIEKTNGGATHNGDGVSAIDLWRANFVTDGGVVVHSPIATTTAAATRAAELFYWDYSPVPQFMFVYLRYVVRRIGLSSILFEIGDTDGATPWLIIQQQSTDLIKVLHDGGAGAVNSALAAPVTIGDDVRVVALLNANGSVQAIQSINGGAASAGAVSGVSALAAAWHGTKLMLNSEGAASVGDHLYTDLRIVKGADVVAATSQGRLDELAAFEVGPNGLVL